jgi:hypothetical protein
MLDKLTFMHILKIREIYINKFMMKVTHNVSWIDNLLYAIIAASEERTAIIRAMKHVAEETCVRFKPRSNEMGYVRIYKNFPGSFCFPIH